MSTSQQQQQQPKPKPKLELELEICLIPYDEETMGYRIKDGNKYKFGSIKTSLYGGDDQQLLHVLRNAYAKHGIMNYYDQLPYAQREARLKLQFQYGLQGHKRCDPWVSIIDRALKPIKHIDHFEFYWTEDNRVLFINSPYSLLPLLNSPYCLAPPISLSKIPDGWEIYPDKLYHPEATSYITIITPTADEMEKMENFQT